ncbi:MAG: arginase, partial [Patiriisocius sp.]
MIEFLTPVSKPVIAHREVLPAGTIGKQLLVHTIKGELPDLEDVKFAIFGCKENRRDVDYMGLDVQFDTVRMSLYGLYPGNWKHTIADLGDIEKGASVEDSYFAVKAVTAALLKK